MGRVLRSCLSLPSQTQGDKISDQANRGAASFSLFVGLLLTATVDAHPLGNNTVNRQARINLGSENLVLGYLVDMAEIPTLVETQEADGDQDGQTSSMEWDAYARRWAAEIQLHLHLTVNAQPVPLALQSQTWSLLPGAAGLSILRLEAKFGAPLTGFGQTASLRYQDENKPGQIGWKEIWISASSDVRVVQSTAPRVDRSHGLTDFTLLLGAEAPNELAARAEVIFAPTAPLLSSTPTKEEIPGPAVEEGENGGKTGQSDATATQGSHPKQKGDMSSTLSQTGQSNPDFWLRQAWPFFRLGMHHIATGWDHLAFLLGLLLLRQSLPQLVRVVTAFTIAHSVTLAFAANGWVTAPSVVIEPAIALTIAYVGLVNVVWRQTRHGAWLAFAFGLVHGFGFAGALAESLVQQPVRNHWLLSLASFNLGIEAFQVLLVCLIVPIMRLSERFAWSGWMQRGASFVVLSAGLGWFFSRTIGAFLG